MSIFISSSPQVELGDMYATFRRFGQIHNICKYTPRKFKIDFATITDTRLNSDSHEITVDGTNFTLCCTECRIRLDEYDAETLQERLTRINKYLNEKLIPAPAQDSPHNIINALNDDCLLHILAELDANDLTNVAKTCRRLNGIAEEMFKSKFSRHGRSLWTSLRENRLEWSLFEIESCIQTFGHEIRSLEIDYFCEPKPELLFRMCVEYCPKIECIDLICPKWNAGLSNELRRLLPRLKQLRLDMLLDEPWAPNDLFVGDWQLEVLELRVNIDWTAITIQLPKLTQLLLRDSDELTEEIINQCILGNPQLCKLALNQFSINASILNRFPTYLPNLQELAFNGCVGDLYVQPTLPDWHRFQTLKSLHLGWNDDFSAEIILAALIAGEVALENLALRVIDDNLLTEYITALNHLKTLRFDDGDVAALDIYRFARDMSELSVIVLNHWQISIEWIKEFLRRFAQPLTLPIRVQPRYRFKMSKDHCNEINELLRAHPGMDFTVEIANGSLDVSELYILIIGA